MKKRSLLPYLFVLSIVFITSCHKDTNESKIVDTRIPGPEIVDQFDGNLTVHLTDLGGVSIIGADIYVYGEEAESNEEGIAKFKNIPLDKSGTHIRALKEGYLFGSITFNPTGIENYVVVKMLPIQNLKTFDSNDNVSIEIDGGGDATIQASSFEYTDGTLFEGEVSLLSYNIDTENSYFAQIIPGDHTGLANNGSLKSLEIYSSVAIFAFDSEGIELVLRENASIELQMQIDNEDFDLAPDETLAWNFETGLASWQEKNSAFRDSEYYTVELSKLGFWACAKSYNFVNLGAKVLGTEGQGLSHLTVKVSNSFSVASVLTDGDGSFYTKIPVGIPTKIEISHPACSEPLYTGSLEAFQNDINLEDIIINTDGVSAISGMITCGMDAISEGHIYIKTSYYTYFLEANNEGVFDIFLSEAICNPDLNLEIFGLDPIQNETSIELNYNYSEINDLVIDVCADCNFQVDIESVILDNCDLLVELTVSATEGSGEYSYAWQDGSAGSSVTVTDDATFCVTVTDEITSCQVIGCKSFIAPDALLSSLAAKQNIECSNNGSIEIMTEGGILPHDFVWFGPDGFSSNESIITNLLSSGVYSYTVTDGNGCQTEGDEMIEDVSGNFTLNVYTSDLNNVICDQDPKILYLDCDLCGIDLSQATWELPDGSFQTGIELSAEEPGIYSVVVDDVNCYAEGSIQLQKAEFVDPEVEIVCLGDGSYDLFVTNLESGFTDEWPSFEYFNMVVQFDELAVSSFLVHSPYASCSKDFEYTLPIFNGMTIGNVNHTSCEDCDDGSIELVIDSDQCSNCLYEDYYIYREGNYIEDLKQQNMDSVMEAGNYFIVAKSDEGCVLNSVLTIIE